MLKRFLMLAMAAILFGTPAAYAQPGKQPGGGFQPFQPPRPGEIIGGFLQDVLKLDADQKKQLGELQKEVDAKLAKILSKDQMKSLENMKPGKGGFGPGFGPGGGNPPGGTPPGGTPGGPPPKMGFGPPGGFGPFGFGKSDDVQKKIGATDEEWKVIGPKLQKVTTARRAANGELGPSTAVGQAQADLKAVLDEPKHTKADVEEKIAAVRKAREKARTELVEAQRQLTQLLTPAQQAIMVSLGHLE